MDQAPEGWSLDWKSMFRIHVFKSRTPGGYSWELLVGVCRPGPQILTLFQTKKCYFSHPFSDLAFKKLCRHYLDYSSNKKYFLKSIRIRIFLFLSYSFGTETINTFVHSRSSLENHTRFQTKMGKIYTLFVPKRRKDPTRWGGTYLYSLYKGVPSLGRTTVHTVFRRLTKRLQPSSEIIVETIVYSGLSKTRTFKGNRKRFELSGARRK